MSVSYEKLKKVMKDRRISAYKMIKTDKIINQLTWDRIVKNNHMTTSTLEKLCSYFQLTPNDILEFIPDEKPDNQE